jgi:hypothetical protein
MNIVKYHLCVLFGLVLLFSLTVTAVNAGFPKKRGVAGGIWEETNESLYLSFDFLGGGQGNQSPPHGWGVGGTPPGKAFESSFEPAGHANSGISDGVHAPEPATMLLLGTGLVCLAVGLRKALKG